MKFRRIALQAVLSFALLSGQAFSQANGAWSGQDGAHWVGSWAASQQIPEPQNAVAADDLRDATLRQVVHLSVGGRRIRVHVSNAFGDGPLHLTGVHVARPVGTASGMVDPGSDRALTFGGRAEVVIPPGAEYVSDALEYGCEPLSDLAVTMHMERAPAQETGHPGSRATSFLAHGDAVSAASLNGASGGEAKKVDHWYFLSGVDVAGSEQGYSVVALGDSITDGHGATTNGNDRWTDVLARGLQASPATRSVGVLNQGIGGNHLLTDGLGPNVLARVDRDVLAQTGVRTVIVLEGINDLGGLARMEKVTAEQHIDLVQRMIGAYKQVIVRAHAHGLRVVGATILPDTGSDYYHPAARNEEDRQAVNQWIRAAGHFDAVVDLDTMMRDPADATRLRASYDSGDHLHPSPVGYRVMGEAFAAALSGGSLAR